MILVMVWGKEDGSEEKATLMSSANKKVCHGILLERCRPLKTGMLKSQEHYLLLHQQSLTVVEIGFR